MMKLIVYCKDESTLNYVIKNDSKEVRKKFLELTILDKINIHNLGELYFYHFVYYDNFAVLKCGEFPLSHLPLRQINKIYRSLE